MNVFFHSWAHVISIAITAPLVYMLTLFFVRLAGTRAISKMNAYDWLVTVAIGTVMGSTVLLRDVRLAEGGVAIGLLLVLQFGLNWITRRSPALRKILKNPPILVVWEGAYVEEGLAKARLSRVEVQSAVRRAGVHDMDAVTLAVVEPDASISVVTTPGRGGVSDSVLHGLKHTSAGP